MIKNSQTAVILANLGGPRSLSEVRGFLLDLLGDPNVIQLPVLLKPFQKLLAQLIVFFRLPKSIKLYSEIGGKSPLVQITALQAQKLQNTIGKPVFIYMNCGKPGLEELKQSLKSAEDQQQVAFNKFIVIPLFPQYSQTTSKTSLENLSKFLANTLPQAKANFVQSFPTQAKFVEAWTERILQRTSHIKSPFTLLFSAHGIPEEYVTKKGDPYLTQVQASVEAIVNNLAANNFVPKNHLLAFQSRLGRAKWLQPYLSDVLEKTPRGETVVIVPISFVSDHVETIHEIGKELKAEAEEKGIKIVLVPGLNCSEKFIECLAELVLENTQQKLS